MAISLPVGGLVWVKKAPDSHLSYMKHQQPMKALHMSHSVSRDSSLAL